MTRPASPELKLSEAAFQQRVIDWAHVRHWHVWHARPAHTQTGWCTPGQGDSGLPDLILARHGTVLLAELKTDKGRATREQLGWLTAAGPHGYLWRPVDWPAVVDVLM